MEAVLKTCIDDSALYKDIRTIINKKDFMYQLKSELSIERLRRSQTSN